MASSKRNASGPWRPFLFLLLAAGLVYLIVQETGGGGVMSSIVEEQTDPLSNNVRQYEEEVEKYAAEEGIADQTDVLLALMMQESGGRGDDPMQASESYCGEVGCIEDPEVSIKQGVSYFATTLEKADGDVKLALQAYNFGAGFIDYVMNRGGEYTQELAISFSAEKYEELKGTGEYSCIREEAEQYDACYGDIYYVDAVLDYYKEEGGVS
ncbi:lysozyme family protein [Halobacillus kuroshimensis]|uniref:Lysozyme family protein n=1 Tax=Halobacillus kuroshimensis TaxID=302481 RepID=A0ABS3DRC4_9BACI|nr:lysozyme family protein [Halobacillus kuroshimensis]MBN8233856.1 lysozyme family protein [Halobacillus kuroshimensis]